LSPQYLVSHYKRKHLDYYTSEIRPQEDAMLRKELGEVATKVNAKFDPEQMISSIKEEVVDHFNANLRTI